MEKVCVRKENRLYVQVPAELDHSSADEIRAQVEREISGFRIREVIFDFQHTVFMDSSGIGMLMGRQRNMQQMGGCVRIIHAGERVRKILELSGITKLIPVEEIR